MAIMWILLALLVGLLIQSIIKNHFSEKWESLNGWIWSAVLSKDNIRRWLRFKGYSCSAADEDQIYFNDGNRLFMINASPKQRTVKICEVYEMGDALDLKISEKAAGMLNNEGTADKFFINGRNWKLLILSEYIFCNPIWFFRAFDKMLSRLLYLSCIFEYAYGIAEESSSQPRKRCKPIKTAKSS